MASNWWRALNFVLPGLGELAYYLDARNDKKPGEGAAGTGPGGSKLPEGVSALPPNYANPEMAQSLLGFLMGQMPGGQLQGLPQYPGQLNPDLASTMLPQVWASLQNNTGIDWMKDLMSGGGAQAKNPLAPHMQDIFSQGAPNGAPLQMMQQIMQTGGTGGAGHSALNDILTMGRPNSQAGQYIQNMADYGIASAGSGGVLRDMALGGSTASSAFLAPFLKQMTYQPAQPTNRVA